MGHSSTKVKISETPRPPGLFLAPDHPPVQRAVGRAEWVRTSSDIKSFGGRMTQSEPAAAVSANGPFGPSPWKAPPVTFSWKRSPSGWAS